MSRAGWAAYLLVATWVGAARVWPVQDWVTTSFAGYWVVARAVVARVPVVDLYDGAVLHARMRAEGIGVSDEMIGPPSLTLTLLPLAHLSYVVARRVWLWGVCLPALVVGFGVAARPAGRAAPLLASVFLLSAPAAESLLVGQVYPIFLVLHLVGLRALDRGHDTGAGLAVAPMMAMRGWYGLPLVAGWAAAGRWRAAIVGTLAAALLVVGSVPLVGAAAWALFFSTHLAKMADNPWAGATGYQTVRSLALHLTTDGAWAGAPVVHAPALARPLAAAVTAALAWLTWRFVRRRPSPALLLAGLTCVELLLSPFTQEYHFVLAALPAGIALGARSRLAHLLVVVGLVLLLPAWDYQAPTRAEGWAALCAYPRLFGTGALFAAVLVAAPGAER